LEKVSLASYASGDAFFSLKAVGISGDDLAAMLLRQKPPFKIDLQSASTNDLTLKANY